MKPQSPLAKEAFKLLTSFYFNKLVCLNASNGKNGSYLGKVIIDLDQSQQGVSASIIRSYLMSVQKKNVIQVDKQFNLSQSLLQEQFDKVFQSSGKYMKNELQLIKSIVNSSDSQEEINGALLVVNEDGKISFLFNQDQINEAEKSGKLFAKIGQVINVQGYRILKELEIGEVERILLSELIPYKQIILNKILLIISGCIGASIFVDLFKEDLLMNMLNPLIKTKEEHDYIFGADAKNDNNINSSQQQNKAI